MIADLWIFSEGSLDWRLEFRRELFAWEEEKVLELTMAIQNSMADITNNPNVVAWSAQPSG